MEYERNELAEDFDDDKNIIRAEGRPRSQADKT